jgi:hypothetical protein
MNHTFTIPSPELADMTDKSHAAVMRDLAAMLPGEYDGARFFMVSKRDSLILASGYGTDALINVLDYWEDVEASESSPPTELAVPMMPATEAIVVADMMSRLLGLNRVATIEKALRLKAPEYLPLINAI